MDTLLQDLKFAIRLLFKDRAFAATTLLTLAVCIGANTAIFTVVRSVLLRPLPYPEADRLVFGTTGSRAPVSSGPVLGAQLLRPVVDDRCARIASLVPVQRLQGGNGVGAEGVSAMAVTPSFFRVLRAQAVRGRLFAEDDGQVGHNHVVVLSHAFAVKQQGGIDRVVGRDIRLNDGKYHRRGRAARRLHVLES